MCEGSPCRQRARLRPSAGSETRACTSGRLRPRKGEGQGMAPLVRGGFPTRKRGREVLSRREEHGNRMVSRPIYFTDTERSLPFPRLCHRRPGTERGSNESVIGGADLPFGVLVRTLIVCFLVGINVSKGARICSASRERARLCWGLSWFQDLPRPVGPTGATKTLRWGNSRPQPFCTREGTPWGVLTHEWGRLRGPTLRRHLAAWLPERVTR